MPRYAYVSMVNINGEDVPYFNLAEGILDGGVTTTDESRFMELLKDQQTEVVTSRLPLGVRRKVNIKTTLASRGMDFIIELVLGLGLAEDIEQHPEERMPLDEYLRRRDANQQKLSP